MLPSAELRAFAARIASLVHSEKHRQAAIEINDRLKLGLKFDGEGRVDNPVEVLQHWLHYLLNGGAMEEAAQLLWTDTQFTPEPQYTKDLWDVFENSSTALIMGGASCSKSFAVGVRLFLEWIRDPKHTSIKVIGPSEAHLEANLFSHIVRLHNTASLPMPGEIGELFIGLDRRDQSSAIVGVVIPVGKVKKAGRLQGTKRVNRKKPHPIFGRQTRLFIFIDEIENVPAGLWSDIDNVLSNFDGNVGGLKVFGAYNPSDITDEVAKRAEPEFGWENFNVEEHYRWTSKRGWTVLRLDPEKCENVVQGKIVYPGLQTREGLNRIALNSGGRQSSGYYTMGRGAYPPQGVAISAVPAGLFNRSKGDFIWYDDPVHAAGADLALEGGAGCVLTLGRFGKATGMKLPPTIDHPQGRTVMFRNKAGRVIPRWALQVDQQFLVPRGDTVATSERLIEILKKAGVRPELFACDRTGHGAGIADLIKHNWRSTIKDLNYSESPSAGKIMIEDTQTCAEQFDRVHTELWVAMRSFMEFSYLLLAPGLDYSALTQQVTQRRLTTAGKKSRIESKKDYVSRGFKSPDEADSLTLFVHAVRAGSGSSFSMTMERGADDDFSVPEQSWQGDYNDFQNGVRLDPTATTDYLRDRLDM